MKKSKGITLMSLVITIVVLIILSGVGINMVIGENGIFTKAKESKKVQIIAEAKEKIGVEILAAQIEATERNEELEQTQIADIISKYGELQEDGDTIILKDNGYNVSLLEIYNGTVTSTGSYSELKAQNALLKQQLEDASKSQSESSKELSELKTALSQVTATESQILKDYTAYKGGQLITGTMENRGELNWKPTSSETYTVPAGYYSGGTLDSSDAYNAGKDSTGSLSKINSGYFTGSGDWQTKSFSIGNSTAYNKIIITIIGSCDSYSGSISSYSISNATEETSTKFYNVWRGCVATIYLKDINGNITITLNSGTRASDRKYYWEAYGIS